MGRGSIKDHNNLLDQMRFSYLSQKHSREIRIHGICDHPVQGSLMRAKGRVNSTELPDKDLHDCGAKGPGSPASDGIAHASDAGFVLKDKQKWLFVSSRQLFLEDFREFFLESSWTSVFALGCRESGVTFRHP